MRHRSRRTPSGNAELAESGGLVYSLPSSPQQNNIDSHPSYNGGAFQSDEVPFAIMKSCFTESGMNTIDSPFLSLFYCSALFWISGVAYLLKSMMKLSCLRLQCLVAFQKEHHTILHTNLIKLCRLVPIKAQFSILVYLVHHRQH